MTLSGVNVFLIILIALLPGLVMLVYYQFVTRKKLRNESAQKKKEIELKIAEELESRKKEYEKRFEENAAELQKVKDDIEQIQEQLTTKLSEISFKKAPKIGYERIGTE
jgi:uncharacterized membrane-anchored protein YhcB (DUF1043 family)